MHVIWNSRKILKDTKKRAAFLLQSLVLVSEALEGANVPRTTVLSPKINISIYVQSCPALALSLRNMPWSCPLSAPQPWPFFPSVIHDLVQHIPPPDPENCLFIWVGRRVSVFLRRVCCFSYWNVIQVYKVTTLCVCVCVCVLLFLFTFGLHFWHCFISRKF